MPQEQEERERTLERWADPFIEAGISLAALAAVRRGEVNVHEAAINISDYTAGIMNVDETRLARELDALVKKGYIELHDGRYRITVLGQAANVPAAEAVEPVCGRHEQPVGLLLWHLEDSASSRATGAAFALSPALYGGCRATKLIRVDYAIIC